MSYILKILLFIFIFNSSNAHPANDVTTGDRIREKRDFNPIEAKLIQKIHPQPVLDTATKDEMCCNTQQHLVGKKIVNVLEKVTSLAANAIQLPKQSANKIGTAVTEYLNQIGGKLVGLQK